MDKRLLDALNNLSLSLEMIADALESKDNSKKDPSNVTKALKGGDFTQQIKSIDEGIKSLKSDTKEIIKNQNTILNMNKQKKDGKADLFEKVGDKDGKSKNKIKDGLSIILMIATGVLAIGLAFSIIGHVDFLSVISLSIALPLVAIAFEKIAQMKGLKIGEMKNIVLITVAMSLSIMLSSYILNLVRPVGIYQLITTVFIAGAFATLAFSIGKLANGVKGIDTKSLWKLPLVLVAASTAIALSSIILGYVRPVGFFQLVTTIMIAAAFAVISLGLGHLVKAIGDAKIDNPVKFSLMLPLILVGIAGAIMLSSQVLSYVKPIGILQLITSVLIAATFVVISYALPLLAKAMSQIDPKDVWKMPIILVAISAAIAASSWILALVNPIPFDTLLSIAEQAIVLSLAGITIGAAMWALNKLGLGIEDVVIGGLLLVVIATTIMASSWVLSIGKYDTYPSLDWAEGVSLSVIAFSVAAIVLGAIAMSGIGALAIIAGAGMVLVVAAAIVATSYILDLGKYDKYPGLDWAGGVAISLGAFGLGMMALGTIVVGSFGLGWIALKTGGKAIGLIAQSIVDTSLIFASGGNWTGGPTEDWAKGVALSIGAFGTVFGTLHGHGIFDIFSSGPNPQDMVDAILLISYGITAAAEYFNKNSSAYTNPPSEEWAAGVGGAIAAFAPVYKYLDDNSGFWSGDADVTKMTGAVSLMAHAIVDVGNIIKDGNYSVIIPDNFINSISNNIKAYVDLASYLSDKDVGYDSILSLFGIANGMMKMSKSYNHLSESVKNLGSALDGVDLEKLNALKSLTGSIILMSLMDSDQFEKMMDALEDKAKIFVDVMNDIDGSSRESARGSRGNLSSIKTGGKSSTEEKSINDLFNVMSRMDAKLGHIAKSNDNVSSYVDEMRTGSGINLRKKK